MSKMTSLTGINTTMNHVPAESTNKSLGLVFIRRHRPRHGGGVLKDEILIKFWKLHIETESGYVGK